jgi:exodeoxyribonuclease VII small subunit
MSASKTRTTITPDNLALDESTLNYEQAFSELEQIVGQMESGQMSLEASLAAYKRGNLLLEFCQKSLAEVEQQVKILNEQQQLATFNTDTD